MNNAGPNHSCAMPDCERIIFLGLLMCHDHWKKVPGPVQEELYGAWHGFRDCHDAGDMADRRARYDAAVKAAITAVTIGKEHTPPVSRNLGEGS